MFLPRSPALYASAADLEQAEAGLDIPALVNEGVKAAALERFTFARGRVERVEEDQARSTPMVVEPKSPQPIVS